MTTRKEAILVLTELLGGSHKSMVMNILSITSILNQGVQYEHFVQKKKSGGIRHLYAPTESLKKIQGLIKEKILYKFPVHEGMCGFVPKIAMKKGVNEHIGTWADKEDVSRWLLKIDLKDFFPSVKATVLQAMFEDIFAGLLYEYGLRNSDIFLEFCKIITELVTYEGKLPQGAPTSPYLANLVVSWAGLADDLEVYCQKNKLTFSIYADDITISSMKNSKPSVGKIIKCIEGSGDFLINRKKTNLNHLSYGSHRVTGISIHTEIGDFGAICNTRLTLPKKRQKFYRGRIRKAISLLRQGCDPNVENQGISRNQVGGYITWIKDVCGDKIPATLNKTILLYEEIANKYDL